MNNQRSRPRPMGLNIGSASIIMLFAVLCLTVLAALSLLSANSQYSLAERSAEVTRAYYAAEAKAVEIFDQVKNGDLTSVDEYTIDGDKFYGYTVEIDEFQAFSVLLTNDGGKTEIRSWKIVEAGNWTPDDFLDLWGGDAGDDGSGGFFVD